MDFQVLIISSLLVPASVNENFSGYRASLKNIAYKTKEFTMQISFQKAPFL